jgi:hypothetical protein
MRDEVLCVKADVGLGFDGDGDRCGVVDNEGEEIFADKVGVMLARDMSAQHPGATFVADVKSTGLFMTDPALLRQGAKTEYWKTGHGAFAGSLGHAGPLRDSRTALAGCSIPSRTGRDGTPGFRVAQLLSHVSSPQQGVGGRHDAGRDDLEPRAAV